MSEDENKQLHRPSAASGKLASPDVSRKTVGVMRRVAKAVSSTWGTVPLSLRGAAISALSLTAITVSFADSRDLYAAVCGGGFLALQLTTSLAATYLRFGPLKRIRCMCAFRDDMPTSITPVSCTTSINGLSLPTFFSLSVERVFARGEAASAIHCLSGKQLELTLHDSITFPHRGLWNLHLLKFQLRDFFGLTKLSWTMPCSAMIEVFPPLAEVQLPDLSSSVSRSGDTISELSTRNGDYFDIKNYDPSDGIKRILWKSYARSGELVVRRPEPALSPEGEVSIFLVAGKMDDSVAAKTISFVRDLFLENTVVNFGTAGLGEVFHDRRQQNHLCNNLDDITHATNAAVWDKGAGTLADFDKYLDALVASGRQPTETLIFCDSKAANRYKAPAQAAAARRGMSAVIVIIKRTDIAGPATASTKLASQDSDEELKVVYAQ